MDVRLTKKNYIPSLVEGNIIRTAIVFFCILKYTEMMVKGVFCVYTINYAYLAHI